MRMVPEVDAKRSRPVCQDAAVGRVLMRWHTASRVHQIVMLGMVLATAALSLSSHASSVRRDTQDDVAVLAAAGVPELAAHLPEVLPASGFVWMPQLSQSGPLLIVVSLPDQRASVYRNGVRIGLTKVSTGRPGFETPTGVFTILQKDREHYSNLYDNAPMPFMQRLTWDGVAMHAGHVADSPASHGCVRLPYAFSEALFAVTARGMTVVVSDVVSDADGDAVPGAEPPASGRGASVATAPRVMSGGSLPVIGDIPMEVSQPRHSSRQPDTWAPERAPDGPLVVVASIRDGEIRVMRNAVEIGRAAMTASSDALLGTRAYVMLEGAGSRAGIVAGRPALRWLEVPLVAGGEQPVDLHALAATGALTTSPAFAQAVYDALVPGSSLVVTDQPLGPLILTQLPILTADQAPAPAAAPVPGVLRP